MVGVAGGVAPKGRTPTICPAVDTAVASERSPGRQKRSRGEDKGIDCPLPASARQLTKSRRKARREHAPRNVARGAGLPSDLREPVCLPEVERQRIHGVACLARDALAEGRSLLA